MSLNPTVIVSPLVSTVLVSPAAVTVISAGTQGPPGAQGPQGPPGSAAALPNVGTPGTYGDATHFVGLTTDAQGRVTAVSTFAVPATGVATFNTRTGDVVLTAADVDAALPADIVQTDMANTFTVGPQTIQTGGAVVKGLIVQGATSQSADLQEWLDAAGNVLARIGTNGGLHFPVLGGGPGLYFANNSSADTQSILGIGNSINIVATSAVNITAPTFTLSGQLQCNAGYSAGDTINPKLFRRDSVLGTTGIVCQIGDGNGLSTPILTIQGNQTLIQPPNASSKGLVIQGRASQSGNLQEWQNSSAAVQARVDVAGQIVGAGVATTCATRTAAYTLTTADSNIFADATTAAFTLTLPAANAVPAGREYTIKKIDATANAVTLARAGTDTIDGATTYVLSAQYKYVAILSDGASKWYIVGAN